jgi:glutamate formiminotransferase/formiminotetrahydrofolate cyclodeaminase
MPNPLVECIPNFSEARRPEIIEAIIASIRAVPAVHVLDRHSDLDHNRTVLTLIGPPQAVEEAAFQSIAKASELINLDEHEGAHPRIGATDVVPFVPISDMNMQDCVEMARRLGKRVGEELSIPVYLYEEAATRPERVNLENIRRGQYEALKEEIGVRPERDPDFGPAKAGTAGATVIGARQPLIAYNVYLTTNDTSVAQNIARAIRHSSGGLRYVKAMGILVEGRAQVSMNLTNFRQTPVARVVEIIRREAARYGVAIHHSELVGLIPQEALNDAAIWHLQLDGFEPQQILEQRLMEMMRGQAPAEAAPPESSFLDALASAEPTPGGGSAGAHTGAVAAALVAMVCRLTVSKKKYEAVKERMWAMLEQAEGLRAQLSQAVDKDAEAFNEVMKAFKLPKDTPEQEVTRRAAVQAATLFAAQVPLDTARLALTVQELAVEAAEFGNINAISDASSASTLARAALTCTAYNVRINTLSLEDPNAVKDLEDQIREIEAKSLALEAKTRQILSERGGMKLE